MLTHIAIAIVAGVLGYLFGLLSPCCRSRKPLGWQHEPMSQAEIEEYNAIVMRATSVPYSVFVGSPDIDNSAREALANYCKRREGQCDGSVCKSGKCPTRGPSPLTSYLKSKFDQDGCNCWACLDTREGIINWFPVCQKCGNKRCPHQADHRFKCTGSNELGQVGELEWESKE